VTSQVGAVLVVASSGGIFCYRVAAIWGGAKKVVGFVCVMYLVMLGCWVSDFVLGVRVTSTHRCADCCCNSVRSYQWPTDPVWFQLPNAPNCIMGTHQFWFICSLRLRRTYLHARQAARQSRGDKIQDLETDLSRQPRVLRTYCRDEYSGAYPSSTRIEV
jgi:hypothetical protein